MKAIRVRITGVVQGVGFRPFVYGLANRHSLNGWVCNTSAGVDIEVEGAATELAAFVAALSAEAPPLARIEQVSVSDIPTDGHTSFQIRHSQAQPGAFQPLSPDIATCADCLQELFDPDDRRYRYPFINCTNCGPRFTIIRDIPYDRPKTTMKAFPLCPDCRAEYEDPSDRRFHAQPNACPSCGPHVELWIHDPGARAPASRPRLAHARDEAIRATRELLRAGKVVALKGLGGFHLACDATNDAAVSRLRDRKGRVEKPFALMAFDLETVRRFCHSTSQEQELLRGHERSIVLLRERQDSPISPLVAPGLDELGVMLPYTPLHYLLLAPGLETVALVMTSGNYSEEPIATDNEQAMSRLADLADAFLVHNRDIHARCDDSVTRVFRGVMLPLRRSRGYAPYPIHLPFEARQVLAVGGELKNTFCLTKAHYAFLSQHIGDMENYETLCSFRAMVEQFRRTFRVEPKIVAHDLHPGYLSTRYALRELRGVEAVGVQHHHAHIAACMAENGLEESRTVIGVVFDGTGYGLDGAIWGGEFLVAGYGGFTRAAHLAYVPLPGGDAAIRRPYRTALAHLWAAGVEWVEDLQPVKTASPVERGVISRQLEREFNAVPTSSMGRLFDAVSAIAGVRQVVSYEAQAAIELETLVDGEETGRYDWAWPNPAESRAIETGPVIQSVVADVRAGVPTGIIAARFHNSVAALVVDVCRHLREQSGLQDVALSGGVWQNVALLDRTIDLLEADGFNVLTHHFVPPNDGGLALGQAVVAQFHTGLKKE